jgi:Ca-activated chloride channel family protein
MKPLCQPLPILFLGVLSLAIFSMGASRATPQEDQSQESTGRFTVDVETIVVNVLVTDRNGKPLAGLQKENFRIFEDGEEQVVQNFFPVDAPFSVGLLLDTSYSTVGKLGRIQDSAIEFLDQIHPDDEVMVISFDDDVYLDTDFTRNKEAVERAIKMTRTGQSTQLYEAVYLGMDQLREQPHRKVMVLFTDGVDTTSPTSSAKETVNVAKEAEVTIYTIFFNTEADTLARMRNPGSGGPGPLGTPPGSPLPFPMPQPTPTPGGGYPGGGGYPDEQVQREYMIARSYLSELAEITGGVRFDAAGNLSDLGEAFAKIAEEMRSLYTIAYVPTNLEEDGKFRKIKVEVDIDKGRVRTRQGYYSRTK